HNPGMLLPVSHRAFRLWLGRLIFAGIAISSWMNPVCDVVAAAPDYLIDVWDTEDNNLPNSTVTAIAQTPDGYLWIGTYDGLARFDGFRFVTYEPVNTPELS